MGTLLKWILNKNDACGLDSSGLGQRKRWPVVNTVMNTVFHKMPEIL
jgi:hypothetical protein